MVILRQQLELLDVEWTTLEGVGILRLCWERYISQSWIGDLRDKLSVLGDELLYYVHSVEVKFQEILDILLFSG